MFLKILVLLCGSYFIFSLYLNLRENSKEEIIGYLRQLLWFLPGGLKKRAKHVQEIMSGWPDNAVILGKWTCAEVKSKSLYRECAREMFPHKEFWPENVVFPFILVVIIPPVWVVFGLHQKYLQFKTRFK